MKNKSKGGKGKDKKKDEKKIVGPPAPVEINENHKEFYIAQIIDLEERVVTLQKKCDELEIKNAEYQVKLDRMIDDQNDIVSFIEKKLARKIEEIKEMKANCIRIQEAKSEEQKLYDEQISAITEEQKQVEESFTAENQMLTAKIAQLEEFQQNRESLYNNIKKLEMDLFAQQSEHKDARYILDKQHRIEKDKLKQEMIEQVKIVANEFKKQSKAQLSETTKRTIRETVAIHNQLIRMSEKTAELIEENEQLKQKCSQQKREIAILEESEKKLIRKNVCNHHTLTLLKAKCQTLGDSLTRGVIETRDKLEELIAERRILIMDLKQARSSLVETYVKNKEQNELRERLKEEVREKTILKFELEKLIDLSAVAIENVIKNCNRFKSANEHGELRNSYNQLLIEKGAAASGSLVTLELTEIKSSRQLSESRPASSLKMQLSQSLAASHYQFKKNQQRFMENIPLYKPGYLGLIPSQDFIEIEREKKINASMERKRQQSHSAPLKTKDLEGKCQFVSKASSIRSKPPNFPPKVIALAQQLVTKMPIKGMKLHPSLPDEKAVISSAASDQMWLS
ncbi:hypothetical protein HELRODRAFT_169354 [Helobdella robusta]|uniref:Cilia- and flagella-associated protein 157 n=1 Tax=Helobdella robusta TaxID=6412 RepID=T1F1T9_HELRO|nr:hypothetical protein HELRODRAFT_169354 [Helobdella robusta]ESO08498.1 hypothetical protein HELRODRAFT_169354 [Helobdella robusta]